MSDWFGFDLATEVTELIWYEFESLEEVTGALEELKSEVSALEKQSPITYPASVKGCRLALELAGAAMLGKQGAIQVAFRNFWQTRWWDCFAENLSRNAYEYRSLGPIETEPEQVVENLKFFERHQPGLVNKIHGIWKGTNGFYPEGYEGGSTFFEDHLVGLSFEMAFHLIAGHPNQVAEGLRVVWGYESKYR